LLVDIRMEMVVRIHKKIHSCSLYSAFYFFFSFHSLHIRNSNVKLWNFSWKLHILNSFISLYNFILNIFSIFIFLCYNVTERNDAIEMTSQIITCFHKHYLAVRRKFNFYERPLTVDSKHVFRHNGNATYLSYYSSN
jgi:hypothetical protein